MWIAWERKRLEATARSTLVVPFPSLSKGGGWATLIIFVMTCQLTKLPDMIIPPYPVWCDFPLCQMLPSAQKPFGQELFSGNMPTVLLRESMVCSAGILPTNDSVQLCPVHWGERMAALFIGQCLEPGPGTSSRCLLGWVRPGRGIFNVPWWISLDGDWCTGRQKIMDRDVINPPVLLKI